MNRAPFFNCKKEHEAGNAHFNRSKFKSELHAEQSIMTVFQGLIARGVTQGCHSWKVSSGGNSSFVTSATDKNRDLFDFRMRRQRGIQTLRALF
jgi:hypothetical protein